MVMANRSDGGGKGRKEDERGFSLPGRSMLVTIFTAAVLTSILSTFMMTHLPSIRAFLSIKNEDEDILSSQATFAERLLQLKSGDRTVRIGCRELVARAQTCVFEGMACINVSAGSSMSRASVIFVDSTKLDGAEVSSDKWCHMRHTSADPRYYSTRHWPLLIDTVAPQASCLQAVYRSPFSLFYDHSLPRVMDVTASDQEKDEESAELSAESLMSVNTSRVKWVSSLSLVDLDYDDNAHNNHLFMDILWLLDIDLFQESLDFHLRDTYSARADSERKRPRGNSFRSPSDADSSNEGDTKKKNSQKLLTELLSPFRRSDHVYLPQSRKKFEQQTYPDINRLIYSIILRKDSRKLYPTITDEDLHKPPLEKRKSVQLYEAYPELFLANVSRVNNNTDVIDSDTFSSRDHGEDGDGELIFHQDLITNSNETDLICTPRMMVGAKIGDGAHERVCREIRTRAFELFGIERPPVVRRGQIGFPQPPKSILVLNRHISRKIGNAEELVGALKSRFEPMGVSVNYITTVNLSTAEEFVRVYSSAGVIITPHGSHNMGQLFMHRYSALVEVTPVGYVDYAFNLLSEACRIWYYEIPSSVPKRLIKFYREACGKHIPHMLDPCNEGKTTDVWVNISKAVDITTLALERLGHGTGTWLSDIHQKN